MMSPLKLSVIVCGAAAGLAVAPYMVKQILPPAAEGNSAVVASAAQGETASTDETALPIKLDLPVSSPAQQKPVAAVAAPAVTVAEPKVSAPQPELALPAAALPSPAATLAAQADQSLPSLNGSPAVASAALPAPVSTPLPTPRPTPVPTPEIPFRSDVETAQKLMKDLGINTGKIDGKLGPNTQAALRAYQKKNALGESGDVNSELITHMEKAVAAAAAPTPAPEPAVTVTVSDSDSADDAAADDMKISQADNPDTLIVRKADDSKAAEADTTDATELAAAEPALAAKTEDPGPVPTLKTQDDVKKLQARLKDAGTYSGDVDGKWGDLTRQAMREFQEKVGIEVTGKPNKETWLAMHAGNAADEKAKVEPAEIAKKPADKPRTEKTDEDEYVVTLNGDGSADPEAKKPMATPRAIGSRDEKIESDSESTKDVDIKVVAPAPIKSSTDKKSGDKLDDLAVAREDREKETAELRKKIQETRAEVKSVSNDSNLNVKKYAPKILETVNNMADGLEENTEDTQAAQETISKIQDELKKAKEESSRKKAEVLVQGVRTSYKSLKSNFPNRIKILSLADDEEKAQREQITEFVASIDAGFEAMEKDFKIGKFGPIFENSEKFKGTIDEVNRGLAEIYVDDKLSDKAVKSKLDKDEISEIESLIKKEEHVKAADALDKNITSSSKKKN